MNAVLISQFQFQQNKPEELSSRAVFQQLSTSDKHLKQSFDNHRQQFQPYEIFEPIISMKSDGNQCSESQCQCYHH